MAHYDLVVIGSGPGGYVAAIRAAQLGKKTALIEKYNTLGGTCLNVGCIPSKALLDSSHRYEDAKNHFADHGIDIKGDINLNFAKMIERKDAVVSQTCSGVDFLMNKNKVSVYHGVGTFLDNKRIKINMPEGKEEIIEAGHVIIATGSKPVSLPSVTIDKQRVITSTEALSLKEIPKHLMIIGGGVIGLELGQVYRRLGSEVSIIEFMSSIIPAMDGALSKELLKLLKKQGIKFYLKHKVTSVNAQKGKVVLKAIDDKEAEVVLEGDYCLVCVGRRPYTEGLGLDKAGVVVNHRGQVEVNAHLQTSQLHIYAIGDVIQGPMLAHKAEEEGIAAVEHICGQSPHIDYNLIPGVVYTWPEVASVGKTEEQLKEAGISYKAGQFPMRALGRARAGMDTDGFVKILADAATDEVLGVHIIGARAADLIAEAVTAMEYRASAEDICRISHAHPTYSEALREAAFAATDNRAIHI